MENIDNYFLAGQAFSFCEKQCEHSLRREITDKKTGEKKMIYMHHGYLDGEKEIPVIMAKFQHTILF